MLAKWGGGGYTKKWKKAWELEVSEAPTGKGKGQAKTGEMGKSLRKRKLRHSTQATILSPVTRFTVTNTERTQEVRDSEASVIAKGGEEQITPKQGVKVYI